MNSVTIPLEITPQLEKYRAVLESAAKEDAKTPIFNEGKEHAAILMSVIFDNAKDYVDIYCNALNPELSMIDVYYDSLKNCLDRGVKIRLALQSSEAQIDDGAIALIKAKKDNIVKILTSEENNRIQQLLGNINIHFAVSDEKAYRLEYDPTNFKATSSFNDPLIANALQIAFNSVF